MTKGEKNQLMTIHFEGQDWYTAAEAAKVMSTNAGRVVKPDYLRSLARLNKVTTKKLGHDVLYLKANVDAYVVEPRGMKVARAQKARFKKPDEEMKKAS